MQALPIRVLVTAFAPVPGSSPHAAAVLGLAAALRAEVEIVTVKTDTLSHMEQLDHSRMLRVPLGLGKPAEQRRTFGRAIARQLESQPYDVVHVRGPIEGRVVAKRAASLGFRFVYEMATFPDEAEGPDAERTWTLAHEECCEAADLILVSTDAAARALSERGHAGKVAVTSPGVDVNKFDWWPGGTGPATRVLYLGGFHADRDLATLLGALRTLQREQPVEALLAGDADLDRRERLQRMVRAFDLERTVVVRGEPKPQMLPMVIGATDVCVAPASASPRFQELGDLPEPLLEYLACRRAVVAAGVPALGEIVRDDHEALLYEPGDESSLAEALRALLADGDLRERLVAQGYDRVRSSYSEGARRRRLGEVYEMLFPGSQVYDPWDDGFERTTTGMTELPSDILSESPPGTELTETIDDEISEAMEAEPTSIQGELSGEQTSPAVSPLEAQGALDTSPALDPPDDLGAPPTRVAPPPPPDETGEPQTEEQPRPAGPDEDGEPSFDDLHPVVTPDESDTEVRLRGRKPS